MFAALHSWPSDASPRGSRRAPRCPRLGGRNGPAAAEHADTQCCEPPSTTGRPPPLALRSPTGSFEQVWTFFYQLPGRFQDLDGHRLLAHQTLQILDLLLELPNSTGRNHVLSCSHRRRPAPIDQVHPIAQDRGLNLQLPGKLRQSLLAGMNSAYRLPLKLDRKDATPICLPAYPLHRRPPF